MTYYCKKASLLLDNILKKEYSIIGVVFFVNNRMKEAIVYGSDGHLKY